MAKKTGFFSRFRLVYRRSSPLLKCAVLATIVLSTVALIALRVGIMQYERETDALRQEAAQLERENSRLENEIAQLGTVQSVKRIAMEELGLVDPNDSFFDPVIENED